MVSLATLVPGAESCALSLWAKFIANWSYRRVLRVNQVVFTCLVIAVFTAVTWHGLFIKHNLAVFTHSLLRV